MTDDSSIKMKIELDFLSEIERGEVITQMSLKERLGVSVGLVNALLKRAVSKGFVKVQQVPYKRYAYYLTPQGFSEKSRLVAAYLETSMDFLRQARMQYAAIFDEAIAKEKISFVLAGDGELAEIAILSTMGKKIAKIAVLDPSSDNAENSGMPVFKSIKDCDQYDLIIITDAKNSQSTFEKLRAQCPTADIVWPPLLHITPDKEDLIRRQEEFA